MMSARRSQQPSPRAAIVLAALALAALCTPGCLRPTMQITSEPTGAAVIVNGEFQGTTPVVVPFIWYWFYEVEVRRDGYKTRKARERLYAPPYYIIPLDLIAEILPFQFGDSRYYHYYLEPETASTFPD